MTDLWANRLVVERCGVALTDSAHINEKYFAFLRILYE